MPVLFELEQLASYMQTDGLDAASAALARDLAAALIRAEVGAARYDALSDLSPFLPVALEVARRVLLNPGGVRSEQVDDYSVTYATEFVGGAALTESEAARVRAAAGMASSGAFTIRPAAPVQPVRCARRWL
ncbi:hypothetical protein DKT68_15290 [Micromonospora acroterricola]|uniref:Head-to-tail adaptor n=1 Tax=Micromonospora acroterricola TaxID=2202421 RepID=A0A317D1K9_9ACTN|nr:hypothetical protein [Micromonospora acroterricola]PWR08579.1 hypothetical protein DKT68_15290 [Micromonospora acroterricola]